MAGITTAMGASLAAPAAVQAAFVLAPGVFAVEHVAAATACALAGTCMVVPALVRQLLDGV